MDWDKSKEYKFGIEWAIRVIELGRPKEMILAGFNETSKYRDEAWARGAYAILIDRGIVSYLGKSEAAKQTGYTRNAIQKAIENGYLKATLVDGHYNIHPLDLEAWRNSDKKRKPYKKIEKP